jgi:DNA modification methylase
MAIAQKLITDRYAVYLGDCMEVMQLFDDGKIDLSIYSPPFAGLYQYSSSERDLSNCLNREEFFEHYEFVVKEIHRLTKPGRMTAVHCTDIPTGNSGLDALIDFPGDVIRLHERIGFKFVARYHVWKEPLTVRNRTMTKSLSHKMLTEDSTRCSIANADQLLIFRRSGKNAIPVTHPHGLLEYAGWRPIPNDILPYRNWQGSQLENKYSHWIWRQYASAFWDDVRIDRVLPYRPARDFEDEKHVHPLQLDVIERCLVLWSNLGEVVLTPFMGIGSEVYGAVSNGRKAIGIELKPSYYRQAVKNLEHAQKKIVEQDTPLFAN